MKRFLSIVLPLLLTLGLLAGCKETDGGPQTNGAAMGGGNAMDAAGSAEADLARTDADMFTNRDLESGYDERDGICIWLNGDSAAASSESVKISGTTITITEDATYIISGALDDGMIIVNAEETAKPRLVLNGASIHGETSAPLYILEADKVFVTLADGTDNTLSNGGTFTAIDKNNIDSVIFSKQDLTLNGSGTLTVLSPAGHGIVSKDDLVITGGAYYVSSASHGLDANDSVRITGNTSLVIDAGKDGIHAENNDDASRGFVYISDGTIRIDAADDGIHSNTSVTINGGAFEIASGDDAVHADECLSITAGNINISESYEGLEALSIAITGGDIRLNARDDGINAAGGRDSGGINGGINGEINGERDAMLGGRDAMFGGGDGVFGGRGGRDGQGNPGGRGGQGDPGGMTSSNGSIVISGGNIYIKMGGDGLDANGSVSITGGSIIVSGANGGDTSILDFDTEGTISGGTFIGTGASGMAQNFSSSSAQGAIMVTVDNQSSGTEIKLADSNGNVLVSHTADRDFSCVLISHASIAKGETYTLTVGSLNFDITMDDTVYGTGNFGGRGGNGNGVRDGNWNGGRDGIWNGGRGESQK